MGPPAEQPRQNIASDTCSPAIEHCPADSPQRCVDATNTLEVEESPDCEKGGYHLAIHAGYHAGNKGQHLQLHQCHAFAPEPQQGPQIPPRLSLLLEQLASPVRQAAFGHPVAEGTVSLQTQPRISASSRGTGRQEDNSVAED
eukprot:scaffold251756_cov32-Prasinocladus_malaysianus.AAC.1